MTSSNALHASRKPIWANIVFAFLMSGLMSIFFAGLFGFLAYGASTEWLRSWAEGVMIAWPLGGLLAAITAGPLRRFSDWVTKRIG